MNIDVQTTFTDIVESGVVSNQHIYNLASYFNENSKKFLQQLEGCYLKIIKNFTALSKQQRRLFEQSTEKFFTHLLKEEKKSKESVISLVRHFLRFFAEGLESSQFLIRICCGRHLFMLLRAIQPSQLNAIVDEKLSLDLLNNTVTLFRSGRGLKNSKTERGLAVKLGAYLQHIQWDDGNTKVKQGCCMLRSEMVRTLCEEERKDLRLDALTNLELNETTMQYVIVRVRDTDVGVRLQVMKKLMKCQLFFSDLDLCDLYQLLHDGLRNSSMDVRKQCQVLVMTQVYKIKDQVERELVDPMQEEKEEEIQDKENLNNKKRVSNARKRTSSLNSELEVIRRTLQRFLALLKIEHTLIFPAIYDVMVEVVKTILIQYREPTEIALYLKDLLSVRMNTLSRVNPEEVFFGRVTVKTQDLDASIAQTIDVHFLDGIQISDYLENRSRDGSSLLEIYEVIQMASCLINCDETGRHRLQQALKRLILNPRDMMSPRSKSQLKHNEIYENITEYEIESRWFGLHHFETPIVRDYYDLILPAVKVLNKLHPNDSMVFAHEICNMINTIRLPVVGLSEDIEEGNLTQHRRSIELKLKIQEEQREDQLARLKNHKKAKNQQQVLLEAQHNETIQYIQTLEYSLQKVDKSIADIDTHALYLVDAIFNQVDRGIANEAPLNKLRDMVLLLNKQYHEQGSYRVPKQMGLKCLSYVPLFDQQQCQKILAIFINILATSLNVAQADVLNGEDPTLIISLRSILDCLLLYNFDDNTEFGVGQNLDKDTIINIVANLAIKSRGTLQCTALEGLCKLLLHQKITNSLVYVALLLFLWFDRSIKEQHLQLQIVTTFFKCFITSSVDLLKLFEKGLEVYTCVCCFMNSKSNLKLNQSYLSSGHWQEGSILRNTTVGIKMLHYKTIMGHPSYTQIKTKLQQSPQQGNQFYLGPQEQFIVYLCKMVGEFNSLVLRNLLNNDEFDFISNYDISGDNDQKIQIEPGLYEILSRLLKSTVDVLEEKGKTTVNEQGLLKSIYDALGTEVKSDTTILSCEVVNEEFIDLKQHVNFLVKFMKENQIIVEESKSNRDRDLGIVDPVRQNQNQNLHSDQDSQEDLSQSPQKRPKQISEEEQSDESDEIQVPQTKGRKKIIQKRKIVRNK